MIAAKASWITQWDMVRSMETEVKRVTKEKIQKIRTEERRRIRI